MLVKDDFAKPTPDPFTSRAVAYAAAERRLIEQWQEIVAGYASRGVCVWGAGAKGVTFANLVDPEGEWIDCFVDLNPAKQGGFLPGTGHAIVGPSEVRGRKLSTALVLNPNYTAEIAGCLACASPRTTVVDLSQSLTTTGRAA